MTDSGSAALSIICNAGIQEHNQAPQILLRFHLRYLVPPCSIRSHPPLTTPTKPPVCTISPPPPLNLYSTSARPCIQATLVCGGTSNLINSPASAVSMSASARPLLVFSTLTVLRQDVMSEVSRSVSRMSWMSEG